MKLGNLLHHEVEYLIFMDSSNRMTMVVGGHAIESSVLLHRLHEGNPYLAAQSQYDGHH